MLESNLYYFDSVNLVFATLTIATGTGCRACIDDPRKFNETNSDVIFAYVRGTNLYYRQQRDRYLTEYTVGAVPNGYKLRRVAANVKNRLQFKLST